MQNLKKFLFLLTNIKCFFLFFTFSLNASENRLPIVKAIDHGDLELVKELVENGADLDILVSRKYPETVYLANGDICYNQILNESILHRVLRENYKKDDYNRDRLKILRYLITKFKEKGISIDKVGTSGSTALMFAVSEGIPPKYAKVLIKEGADVNFNYHGVDNPFKCAIFASGPTKWVLKHCLMLKKAGAKLNLSFDELIDLVQYSDTEPYKSVLPFVAKNAGPIVNFKRRLCKLGAFLHLIGN